MFIENKYYRWYLGIVTKAQKRGRLVGEYGENHHIIPKCMEGRETKANMAHLRFKEHFLCHWLLLKCVEDGVHRRKMGYAFARITHCRGLEKPRKIVAAWQYAKAKEVFRKASKSTTMDPKTRKALFEGLDAWRKTTKYAHSEETKRKIGESNRGKKPSPEVCELTRLRFIGKPLSEEHRKKMSEAHQRRRAREIEAGYKRIVTEEQRQSIREKLTGRKASPETCAKLSKIKKGKPLAESARLKLYGNKHTLGFKHREESKVLIGENSKRRWANKEYAEAVKNKISEAHKKRWAERKEKALLPEENSI